MASDPSEVDVNESPEENRAIAGHLVGILVQVQSTALEATIGLAKWVLTSLLAINGAAAIATWQIDMPAGLKVGACACFVLGVLTSLLCAYVQVRSFTKAAKPLAEFIGYWMSVQVDGLRGDECEDFAALERVFQAGTLLPILLGWASALLFASGAILAGYGGLQLA